MSGGTFDYRERALVDLQDMIAREIGYIKYGSHSGCVDDYNKKTLIYMKLICEDLDKLSKVIHSLDYFINDDIDEKKFISDYEKTYNMENK